MAEFSGKVALVSGGGSGIGAETAKILAAGGASVVLTDIDLEAAQAVVEEITQGGGGAVARRADVSRPEDAEASVTFATDTFGGLHLAFNNAGIVGAERSLADLDVEEWRQVIDVNLNGVFYGMKYQLPQIVASGGGAIVNTSSVAGITAVENLSHYTASKHGVAGVTKAAALEYSRQGVRVNSVHPGYVLTPFIAQWTDTDLRATLEGFHPIGRLGEPREIAEVVCFLLSDRASFVSGAQIVADGGYLSV